MRIRAQLRRVKWQRPATVNETGVGSYARSPGKYRYSEDHDVWYLSRSER